MPVLYLMYVMNWGTCDETPTQTQTHQRWVCLETGHISTPGGLARFQNARGIDTSKRKRIA